MKIYNFLKNLYIRLTNKRNRNLKPLEDSYDYRILPKFRGCNFSIVNPIECVYFSLLEVYKNLPRLKIQGVRVDYSSDPSKIIINIYVCRPSLIIGLREKDINKLEDTLTKYFGKKTKVNLTEEKDLERTLYYID